MGDTDGLTTTTEGVFKKKLGPLEVWQYAAGLIGIVAAYWAYKSYKSGGSTSASSTPSVSTSPMTDLGTTQGVSTLSGQIANVGTEVAGIPAAVVAQSQQTPITAVVSNQTPGSATTPSAYSSEITGLYGLLGRAPDAPGATYWQGFLNGGHTLGQTFVAFENSPEAVTYAQNNRQAFVTAQYNDLLGRAPDPGGLTYWEGQLGTNPTQASVNAEAQAFQASAQKENPAAK